VSRARPPPTRQHICPGGYGREHRLLSRRTHLRAAGTRDLVSHQQTHQSRRHPITSILQRHHIRPATLHPPRAVNHQSVINTIQRQVVGEDRGIQS